MITVAVLGAGRIGQIHARNVAAHPDARLAGIMDLDGAAARRLAEALGAQPIALNDAFAADAVMICTPTPTHADLIERAAAAGKAIFCEKPIDLDSARVRACLEAVRRAGIPLMVGFNRRFDPNFHLLHDRLRGGEIGRLELLTITSRDPQPPPPSYVASSGGLFRDMMIHDLDMARFLLNEEPTEVYALGSALVDRAIGDAGDVDTAAVLLRTSSRRDRPDLQLAPRHLRLRPADRSARRGRHAAGRQHDCNHGGIRLSPPASRPNRRCRFSWNATPRHTARSSMRSSAPSPVRLRCHRPARMVCGRCCSPMRQPNWRAPGVRSSRLRPDHKRRPQHRPQPEHGDRAGPPQALRSEKRAQGPVAVHIDAVDRQNDVAVA